MSLLLSPVRSIKQRLARRRQMRIALQMLAVSGVLRPGDSELRYTVPLTRKRLGSDLRSRSTSAVPHARQAFPPAGSCPPGSRPHWAA